MNETPAVTAILDGNQSVMVRLPNGRSFELSFEQLLAHLTCLQDRRRRMNGCETSRVTVHR